MMPLREALEEVSRGWKDDLGAEWREALRDVEPDLDAVDPALQHEAWEPIFPTRRGKLIPGAPPHAHVFRALDGLRPADVRAIVVGQDPYPNLAWATGRAFEQGGLADYPEDPRAISGSLRSIIQVLAAFRTGRADYLDRARGWSTLVRDLRGGALELPAPGRLFDAWQRKGVLFLNAGLTLSRYERGGAPHQSAGHIPFWRPVVQAILRHVAARATGSAVFLLWGSVARQAFRDGGVEAAARGAGSWKTRVDAVQHSHPTALTSGAPSFFRDPNPFADANAALRRLGGKPVDW
jgi:uracil-DNA glycosylase